MRKRLFFLSWRKTISLGVMVLVSQKQPPVNSHHFWVLIPVPILIVVVQLLSHVPLFVTLTAAHQVPLSSPVSWSLLKLMSNESVMLSNHHILCHPLLLPSTFSSIRVFANESALRIRWPKYWSFSFSVRPSNEYSGFVSFRMDWFDLLAVQGTFKSLLQHYS